MRARKERAVAHAALIQLRVLLAREGKWGPGCTDHLVAALEFTEPRPRWWDLHQVQRVKRRAARRWAA